jgi:hypothetical protein
MNWSKKAILHNDDNCDINYGGRILKRYIAWFADLWEAYGTTFEEMQRAAIEERDRVQFAKSTLLSMSQTEVAAIISSLASLRKIAPRPKGLLPPQKMPPQPAKSPAKPKTKRPATTSSIQPSAQPRAPPRPIAPRPATTPFQATPQP